MSEDEQRELTGQILENLSAARKELACLEHKRDRYLEVVAKGLQVLRGDRPGYYKSGYFLEGRESGLTIIKPETDIPWPSLSEVGELINGMNDAKAKATRARDQLRRMGHDVG